MTNELPVKDTPLAVVRYTPADRVEVRFKPDLTFTVEGIQQMMVARQELGATGPHKAMILMPEHVDFDLDMITTDHYKFVPQPNAGGGVGGAHRTERHAHAHVPGLFPATIPERGVPGRG